MSKSSFAYFLGRSDLIVGGDKDGERVPAERVKACIAACTGIPTSALSEGCIANLVISAVNVMQRLEATGNAELEDGNDFIAAGYHETAADLRAALAPFTKEGSDQ